MTHSQLNFNTNLLTVPIFEINLKMQIFVCPSFATMIVSPDESMGMPKRRVQGIDVCAQSSSPQSSLRARYSDGVRNLTVTFIS